MENKIRISQKDKKRNLKLPENYSEELAEIFGILTGDGYIGHYPSQHKYLLEITGDKKLDKHYHEKKLEPLFYNIFNIKPACKDRKQQNTRTLRIISKGIVTFLFSKGFPLGKKGDIKIPDWIKAEKTFFRKFLRGYFDTDGSIYFRKNYPILSFASISKPLILDIENFLKKEQFSFTQHYKEIKIDKRGYAAKNMYKIRLNGHANLRNWLERIGFLNERHLRKIKRMGPLEFESRI